MSDVLQEVDERSKLAGTNKFELLIFRLGEDRNSNTREVFGMNVFKVREALIMPLITPMPGSPKHVLGVANIRGQIIPVIDLPSVVGCTPSARNILLVTEYERSVQGFAVEEVEEIVRLEWSRVVSAEKSAAGALVTSLARLDEKEENARLALILDVESILRETLPSRFRSGEEITHLPPDPIPHGVCGGLRRRLQRRASTDRDGSDSAEATLCRAPRPAKRRGTICKVLRKRPGLPALPIAEKVAMVLTDLEMPEMDGFTLTRQMKEDDFLKSFP